MNWVIIRSDNWKPHVIPTDLADALVKEMRVRGSEGTITRRPPVPFLLDCGGMCYIDRPLERFSFRGLSFEVPSEHVMYFFEQLRDLPPRQFGAHTYYKLHGHYHCIVLTSPLRQQFLRALRRRIDRAEAKAVAFYADKKPTNEILADIAKKTTGEEISPEAFGPDRQARFRRRARA